MTTRRSDTISGREGNDEGVPFVVTRQGGDTLLDDKNKMDVDPTHSIRVSGPHIHQSIHWNTDETSGSTSVRVSEQTDSYTQITESTPETPSSYVKS